MKKMLLWAVMASLSLLPSIGRAEEECQSREEALRAHGEKLMEMIQETEATFDRMRKQVKHLYRTTQNSFDTDAEKVVHDLFVLNGYVSTQIKNLIKCLKVHQPDRFKCKVDYWLSHVAKDLFEGERHQANRDFRRLSMAIRVYNQYFDRMVIGEEYYNWKYCGGPEPGHHLCVKTPCPFCDLPDRCWD